MGNEIVIENRQWIGRLIRGVIAGEVEPNQAIQDCSVLGEVVDESINRALHALYHFRDDRDIRQHDPAYEDIQVRALASMADRLVEGQPLPKEQAYW